MTNMKTLLSFPSARKACAALVAVLVVIEHAVSVLAWGILAARSRLQNALDNSTGGRGHE